MTSTLLVPQQACGGTSSMKSTTVIDFEMPRDRVHAEIDFLKPTTNRPYTYGYTPGDHETPPTTTFTAYRVVIRNARAEPRPLSLGEHGATLIEHQSRVRDFYDHAQLIDVYYPETADVIKAATGANRVVVFDHNVRRGLSLRTDRHGQGRPVLHAHTDFTEASAVRRLRDHLADEGIDLQRQRMLQLNLWRPIRAPLRDFPLAICDASSISPSQLVVVDLIYPDRWGEIYYLTHDPAQRWYYAPDMQADEAWLFVNYDSETSGTARFAAHSAFNEPSRGVVHPRESIEVRAFALFDV
jgi:hypothetical protein